MRRTLSVRTALRLVMAAPGTAVAQDVVLSGTVTDTTGLVLPGVTVEVRSAAAAAPLGTASTDDTGTFALAPRCTSGGCRRAGGAGAMRPAHAWPGTSPRSRACATGTGGPGRGRGRPSGRPHGPYWVTAHPVSWPPYEWPVGDDRQISSQDQRSVKLRVRPPLTGTHRCHEATPTGRGIMLTVKLTSPGHTRAG